MNPVQSEILDVVARAPARGPRTSHEAARSLPPLEVTRGQRIVLNTFRLARRELTDDELIVERRRHFPDSRLSDSGCRTRRRELQKKGLIALVGYGTTPAGRRCMKFAITKAGP